MSFKPKNVSKQLSKYNKRILIDPSYSNDILYVWGWIKHDKFFLNPYNDLPFSIFFVVKELYFIFQQIFTY